jgi:hypothetical protein
MTPDNAVFLTILICGVPPLVLWLGIYLNRRQILRWLIRRNWKRGGIQLAERAITQARQQRLITDRDELALRLEFGLEA